MKIAIVSGYFNPLHYGHIQYIKDAASYGERLIIIVNNDIQQILKKGKIIMNSFERVSIMKELKDADEVILSIDVDASIRDTLQLIKIHHPNDELIFCNGGDRPAGTIPETSVGGLRFQYEVGGTEKLNSSTSILRRSEDMSSEK